ncbi:MAG: hypothetical protein EKK55_05515 [Rhodocyclaceae bacterium]|nr:MAG: hypothetical protein EKK55_05515 [Rhodocyclaceae bacterium]
MVQDFTPLEPNDPRLRAPRRTKEGGLIAARAEARARRDALRADAAALLGLLLTGPLTDVPELLAATAALFWRTNAMADADLRLLDHDGRFIAAGALALPHAPERCRDCGGSAVFGHVKERWCEAHAPAERRDFGSRLVYEGLAFQAGEHLEVVLARGTELVRARVAAQLAALCPPEPEPGDAVIPAGTTVSTVAPAQRDANAHRSRARTTIEAKVREVAERAGIDLELLKAVMQSDGAATPTELRAALMKALAPPPFSARHGREVTSAERYPGVWGALGDVGPMCKIPIRVLQALLDNPAIGPEGERTVMMSLVADATPRRQNHRDVAAQLDAADRQVHAALRVPGEYLGVDPARPGSEATTVRVDWPGGPAIIAISGAPRIPREAMERIQEWAKGPHDPADPKMLVVALPPGARLEVIPYRPKRLLTAGDVRELLGPREVPLFGAYTATLIDAAEEEGVVLSMFQVLLRGAATPHKLVVRVACDHPDVDGVPPAELAVWLGTYVQNVGRRDLRRLDEQRTARLDGPSEPGRHVSVQVTGYVRHGRELPARALVPEAELNKL